ncbi:MAG: nicotinamide mononucleotide transporter family protein, partial [Huintestinicola sp.]
PNGDQKSEVKIAPLTVKKVAVMLVLGAVIPTAFYFILKALGTANLIPSTISVLTSFTALYLHASRSPLFAAVFLANDLVLIVMWIFAAMTDSSYLPMVMCFSAFLLNDGYSFFNWTRMKKRQEKA